MALALSNHAAGTANSGGVEPAWPRNVRAMAAHALETRDGGLTPPTFPEATLSQDQLDDVLAKLQGLP